MYGSTCVLKSEMVVAAPGRYAELIKARSGLDAGGGNGAGARLLGPKSCRRTDFCATFDVRMAWKVKSLETDRNGVVSDGRTDFPFPSDAVVGETVSVGDSVRVVLAGDNVLELEAIPDPSVTGTRKLWTGQQLNRDEESALSVAIERCPPLSSPWQPIGSKAVGGLSAIGFSARLELLLVSSSAGLGVFDGLGNIVARLRDDHGHDKPGGLLGIGPLIDEVVPMSDTPGFRERRNTKDGWSLHHVGRRVWVTPPDFRAGPAQGGARIDVLDDVRAAAFSNSGNLLAVADGSHTLLLFAR